MKKGREGQDFRDTSFAVSAFFKLVTRHLSRVTLLATEDFSRKGAKAQEMEQIKKT
jgi:hypothetical protein